MLLHGKYTIAASVIPSRRVGCGAADKVVQYNVFFTMSPKLHLKSHLINDYALEKQTVKKACRIGSDLN